MTGSLAVALSALDGPRVTTDGLIVLPVCVCCRFSDGAGAGVALSSLLVLVGVPLDAEIVEGGLPM